LNHERWHVKRGRVSPDCVYCLVDPDPSGTDSDPDPPPESGHGYRPDSETGSDTGIPETETETDVIKNIYSGWESDPGSAADSGPDPNTDSGYGAGRTPETQTKLDAARQALTKASMATPANSDNGTPTKWNPESEEF
jgi:hypothetical protein